MTDTEIIDYLASAVRRQFEHYQVTLARDVQVGGVYIPEYRPKKDFRRELIKAIQSDAVERASRKLTK